MFHWTPRRIEAHVRLCVLALQMQRAAEIRCTLPWSRIAHELAALKAVRYRTAERTIVQRTKIADSLSAISENAWCINTQASAVDLRAGRRPR